MIRVIYGKKGSGKTKRMLAMANDLGARADGSIAFIDVDKAYMYDLDRSIRFIDASEYSIFGADMFLGFIKGIAAQDFDLQYLFVDGLLKLLPEKLFDLGWLFSALETFSEKNGLSIILSVSGSECIPDFLKPYIVGEDADAIG